MVWHFRGEYRFPQSEWENWQHFFLHNIGLFNARIIYRNRNQNKKISDLHIERERTPSDMHSNPPKFEGIGGNRNCKCRYNMEVIFSYDTEVDFWYNSWKTIVECLINYYTQELQKPEYQKIIADCKFSKQLNNPQPKEIEPKDIHYKPPVEVPKSKFQQDIEAMQEQYAQYKRLEDAGLFASFNNSQPISKKSNKNDRNYELRQYLNPSIRFVNSPNNIS